MKSTLDIIHKRSFKEQIKLSQKIKLKEFIVLKGDPRWADCLKEFWECNIFSFDIETFGKLEWHPLFFRTGFVRLIQVGLPSGRVMVCNLGGWQDNRKEIFEENKDFFDALRVKLPDYKTVTIGVNLKFDGVFMLAHYGIKIRQVRDLMLMSQVLWAGVAVLPSGGSGERSLFGHGLKHILKRLGLGEIDKTEQVSNWGWDLSNHQINYGATDAGPVIFSAYYKLRDLIKDAGLTYSAMSECSALPAFIDMEYYGFPVDLELLDDFIKQHSDRLDVVIQPFLDVFPDVNWNSDVQVLEALNDKYPKQKIPNTSAEALAKLDLPECNSLLKARTIQTTLTYLKNLRQVSFETDYMAVRGVYTQIAPEGTSRSSCRSSHHRKSGNTAAQLQNPKATSADKKFLPNPREVFRCPEGRKLIVIDCSAAHARIACVMTKAKVLIGSYNDGLDNHSLLGTDIANIALDYYNSLKKSKKHILPSLQDIFDVSPKDQRWTFDEFIKGKKAGVAEVLLIRAIAKIILYGSLNAAGVGRLTNELRNKGFEWVIEDVVKPMRQFFYDLYPEMPLFIKKNFKDANAKHETFDGFVDLNGNPIRETYGAYGYVTTMTGRRKYLVKEQKDVFGTMKEQVDYGKATASLWLMSEGDMMKDWMGQCIRLFDENPEWGARVCNVSHDELDFTVLEEYAEICAEKIYFLMKEIFEGWYKIIPFNDGDPKQWSDIIGNSWADLH
jgi:DNA polymerase I-like protein with 3'-5' exonuclease and polymerase domains